MRVESSPLILLLTLLSSFTLDLTALDVNRSTPYMDTGSASVPSSVPRSSASSSAHGAPSASDVTSKAAADGPGPSGVLFLLILAAVTAAATTDVLFGELKRHRTARPEWLALNLFVRGRLDGWEELH